MTSEQELLWLVDTRILKPSDLRDLFKGKTLVDAEAVVLSVQDAESVYAHVDSWNDRDGAGGRLFEAIEQARGKNGN